MTPRGHNFLITELRNSKVTDNLIFMCLGWLGQKQYGKVDVLLTEQP